MKKKWLIAIIAVVVLAAAFTGYKLIGGAKNGVVKYRAEALTRGDIESLVVTSGTLNPVTIVDVGSQVTGKIATLNADFNTLVKKGDIVAELDQDQLLTQVAQNQANYQSAQASLDRSKTTLELSQKKFERSKVLFEKQQISFEEMETSESNYLGSKSDLQSAQARLLQAKSQLDTSNVNLTYTIIRSPVDGIVISRNVNVGQTVVSNMSAAVLFKIANDLTKMQVECSIDEADIGQIKEGQNARFTVDAFPQETFHGVVRQVRYSPEVVQNVVTYTTIVDVKNPEMKLRPGMTATVSIITGEAKNAVKIPNSALRFTPPLDPKELEAIMLSAREKMMAKRPAEGQASPAQAGSQARPQGQPEGSAQPSVQGAQAGQGQAGQTVTLPQGNARVQVRRQGSQVWILGADGKPFPVFVRTGVTDDTFTALQGGDLKEGQAVITGLESGSAAPSQTSQRQGGFGGPPGGMMFIRR